MSSWLKLARDAERGSEGGTEARDGDTFDGGDVSWVSLGDDDVGRRRFPGSLRGAVSVRVLGTGRVPGSVTSKASG
jgi:hypothetical protein